MEWYEMIDLQKHSFLVITWKYVLESNKSTAALWGAMGGRFGSNT